MRKDLLGVDIGSKEIKLVTKDKFVIFETPDSCVEGDELIAFDGIADLLKNLIKENGIKAKNACIVLPDSLVYIDRIKMPYMNTKQLEVNLPYEFKDVVGKNKDDYYYDYAYVDTIYDSENKPVELELVISCIKKNIIEKYLDMFKKAGMRLVKAMPRQVAISNMLINNNILDNIALVDIGYNFTRIDFFKDGLYDVTRILENGIKDMNKMASDTFYCDSHISLRYLKDNKDDILNSELFNNFYDDLTLKINRAINYYSYSNQSNTLNNIYLYGGGIHFDELHNTLKKDLNITCMDLNNLLDVNTDTFVAMGVIEDVK